MEVCLEVLGKLKPRLCRKGCEDPVGVAAVGFGGGGRDAADPNRHLELRFIYLEFYFLLVHPGGVWDSKNEVNLSETSDQRVICLFPLTLTSTSLIPGYQQELGIYSRKVE